MFYFDNTYILVIIGLIITMWAQSNVQRAFQKYRKIQSKNGYTGLDVAKYILQNKQITDVTIKKSQGSLSDYYNPVSKQVALSNESLNNSSIAAIAVSAHEFGHVIQYHEGYMPIKIKALIMPVVSIASRFSMPLIFLGILLSYNRTMIDFGIFLFSFVVLFQLVTLPIEIDASKRAIAILSNSPILQNDELYYAKDMLKAAALTYIASALSSALTLLRLMLLFNNRRN